MPSDLRKATNLALLRIMVKPLQLFYDRVLESLKWNSQIASFETYLNGQYSLQYNLSTRDADIASTSIIWIQNTADLNYLYLYNNAEQQPPVYLYNVWDSAINYNSGEFAVRNNKVFVSLMPSNSGLDPLFSPTAWQFVKMNIFFRNQAEMTSAYDFVVWVPNYVVFNMNTIKSQVGKYKLAGKRFLVQLY